MRGDSGVAGEGRVVAGADPGGGGMGGPCPPLWD